MLDDACRCKQRCGRDGSPDRLAGSAGDDAIDSVAVAPQATCAADRRSAVGAERSGHLCLPEVVAATTLLSAGEDHSRPGDPCHGWPSGRGTVEGITVHDVA